MRSASGPPAFVSEPPVQVAGGDTQPTVRKTGAPKLDLVIAFVAIVLSVVSLAVAFENGRTERSLLAASSWPFLRQIMTNQYGDGRDAAIGVSNGGVGPAKLKTLEVDYAGQPVSSSLDLLRRCCGLGEGDAAVRQQLPQGLLTSLADETVLRPGEDNAVLVVHRLAEAAAVPDRFAASLTRIGFRACYCSVLDECWVSDLRTTRTTAVDRCPAPAHPFQPNGP